MAGQAARFQNAGRGVHRVADQRDLSPQGPELADRDRAAMEARAKVGNDAEVALVREALRGDPVVGGEHGADAGRRISAGFRRQVAITSSPTYL